MGRIALSVRQPWATLIVFGIKTIEIRSWGSDQTGEIFIHVGKTVDSREAGWRKISDRMRPFAELTGGLLGAVRLVGSKRYRSRRSFLGDRGRHHNPPDWFRPPWMTGFEMTDARTIEFVPMRGALGFFSID